MQITKVIIKNFRCLDSIEFTTSPTTVLIGENNVGKTAALDAIKIALGRRWGRSGSTGFNQYDFRRSTVEGRQEHLPIEITLELAEDENSLWPQELKDELVAILNTDPITGFERIVLRVSCTFDDATKEVQPLWQFLNRDGDPFSGSGSRNQNISSFFDYLPFHSMAALRDASSEFTSRSRLWAPLLKTLDVPPEKTAELEARFAELNDELLRIDPKLDRIKSTLKQMGKVVASGAAGQVDVRAVPTNLWEILNRAELIVQGRSADPWLPIERHGNGVQSLAVIFLFRAFVENALAETHREESEPILALEEPESHLHPQASRSLWSAISELPGQKFVTTHSPYFAQNVPFSQIVLLRRNGNGSVAVSIPRSFSVTLDGNEQLIDCVDKLGRDFQYNGDTQTLTGRRVLTTDEHRELLRCFTGADRNVPHAALKEFHESSLKFISDEDLGKLESFARRIRGEIFFARKWLLCEGQSDYAVLAATAEVLAKPVDARGVALIDYQNNGSPGIFATTARTLGIPWSMICDGDQGGDGHKAQLRAMNFEEDEIQNRVVQLDAGSCLESLIVNSELRPLLLKAVHDLDGSIEDDDEKILQYASSRKEEIAVRLAALMRERTQPHELPEALRQVFVLLGEIDDNKVAAK